VLFAIFATLVGVFAWYDVNTVPSYTWDHYNKFTVGKCDIYGFRDVSPAEAAAGGYSISNNIHGVSVALCTGNPEKECTGRCYGTAVDMYGEPNLSTDLSQATIADRYRYWCGDDMVETQTDAHDCSTTANGNSAPNQTYYCYYRQEFIEDNVNWGCNSAPTAAINTTLGPVTPEQCCRITPGQFVALRRHIDGTFVIVPFSAVFALIALAGLIASCFLDTDSAYNVYKPFKNSKLM